MTEEQVADAIKYHSIVGDVGYSTAFADGGSYETLLGVNVTVTKKDGVMYINNVAVERANVIMTNGVAHVLSGVSRYPFSPTSPSPYSDTDASIYRFFHHLPVEARVTRLNRRNQRPSRLVPPPQTITKTPTFLILPSIRHPSL